MKEPIAYLKGEFVPASQCVLPLYDLGIVLGAAVTDFLRTFDQRPYRMEDHIERLYRSCKYARIEPPVNFQESIAISKRLLAENSTLVHPPAGAAVSERPAWLFDAVSARRKLTAFFDVAQLDGFGCADKPRAIAAAGALLDYVETTQQAALPHIAAMRTYSVTDTLVLDGATRRNLEIDRSATGDTRHSAASPSADPPSR